MKSKIFMGLFAVILVVVMASDSAYSQCCGSKTKTAKGAVKVDEDKSKCSAECKANMTDESNAFSYEYKGKTYYFESAKLMEEFKADPETKSNQVNTTCCGGKMAVDKRTALKSSHDGQDHYFCSDKCKANFDADPKAYMKKTSMSKKSGKCCGSKATMPAKSTGKEI